jgi:hypothetical protein
MEQDTEEDIKKWRKQGESEQRKKKDKETLDYLFKAIRRNTKMLFVSRKCQF